MNALIAEAIAPLVSRLDALDDHVVLRVEMQESMKRGQETVAKIRGEIAQAFAAHTGHPELTVAILDRARTEAREELELAFSKHRLDWHRITATGDTLVVNFERGRDEH